MNCGSVERTGREATVTGAWVRRLSKPQPATRIRLYCLPFAGGGASAYRRWGTLFGPEVEVCAIQLPGHEDRVGEAPVDSVAGVVDALVPALRPELDVPYAFFGHSMGALLAFELARRLVAETGTAPRHLFASATRAPHFPQEARQRHHLTDAEFIDSLRDTDEMLAAVLADPELTELFLPILRADFSLCELYGYRPGPPLPCPISAFGGQADPLVDRGHLEGWRQHTTAGFALRTFPGGHFFIREHEHQLAGLIAADLHREAVTAAAREPVAVSREPAVTRREPVAVSREPARAPREPDPVPPEFDVARARRDTPGADHVIHFNNAGAALMPVPVVDAMTRHLALEARIGSYEAAERSVEAVSAMYDGAARLLNCDPEEIAFADSATRAWSMAFYSVPLKPGDRILVSSAEYGSNHLALTQVARRTGATVEIVENDESGRVDVDALRRSMDERVRLIVMTHVPTHGGVVNPIAEIGAVAREASVLYLVDACQSVGQLPIDVRELECDFLASCGRKYLRGPRGTGLLYARRDSVDQVEPANVGLDGAQWLDGDRYQFAPAARRFETWEANVAAKIGLGVAIEYALSWGIEAVAARVGWLAARLRETLATMPRVRVFDRGSPLCGLVGFAVDGLDQTAVRAALLERGANVWNCLANTARVDMRARGLDSILRASVHYYNTPEEVARFCELLAGVIENPDIR
jgi:selenocysteine lyase/cysteine desulfurase/surfactin synthase thioesterase subunit